MVTDAGKDVVEEDCEREVVEDSSVLDTVEEESDDTRLGVEGVREGEEVVKVESEVIKLEPDVEKSVVNDEPNVVEENGSSEDVDMRVNESETSVRVCKGNEVDGSIVMDGSENELEVNTVLNDSVGRVNGVEVSVKVGVSDVGSPEVSGSVSSVPVLDGNASVIVGSSVSVSVGDKLISKDVDRDGIDVGKSVGVSDRNVGSISPFLVENGGIMPVKVMGGRVRKAVSNPLSWLRMEGVDKPQ